MPHSGSDAVYVLRISTDGLLSYFTGKKTKQNKRKNKKLGLSDSTPPLPVLPTNLFVTSPPSPLPSKLRELSQGWLLALTFTLPFRMLPKHSYFLINYFLVFPNLLLRLLFTAPKACDCEPCPPKATETSDHKVLSLFLPLVFPFSCGSLEFVLAFARSLIPQGPTLSAALRQAHRRLPRGPHQRPWLGAADNSHDQLPAGLSPALASRTLSSPALTHLADPCQSRWWFLFLWPP